jgi:hypothetical protein
VLIVKRASLAMEKDNPDSVNPYRRSSPVQSDAWAALALQGLSSLQEDRSSPVQSERFRPREGRSQC